MPIFIFHFFSIISKWQLYVAIATRVLIQLEQKTISLVPPANRCYMWNIGFMASEEMSSENVDDGQMDVTRMPGYTICSGKLKKPGMCTQQRTDQTGWMSICPVWSEYLLGAKLAVKVPTLLHADSKYWSDWADAQADLSLRWVHRSFFWFCHALAH